MRYNINLDQKELAIISQALENMPYKMVVHLISNISEQIQQQQSERQNDNVLNATGRNNKTK